jgi:hypothetical protein
MDCRVISHQNGAELVIGRPLRAIARPARERVLARWRLLSGHDDMVDTNHQTAARFQKTRGAKRLVSSAQIQTPLISPGRGR